MSVPLDMFDMLAVVTEFGMIQNEAEQFVEGFIKFSVGEDFTPRANMARAVKASRIPDSTLGSDLFCEIEVSFKAPMMWTFTVFGRRGENSETRRHLASLQMSSSHLDSSRKVISDLFSNCLLTLQDEARRSEFPRRCRDPRTRLKALGLVND
jgi:hypothetical protein